MTKDQAPGWRSFTVLALVLLAAAVVLPLTGVNPSSATVHGASAVVFLAIGGWALAGTRQGRPMHALIGGLLLLAASAMSFVATFLPGVVSHRLAWSMALAGAFSAIALDLVMARYAEELEELRG